MRNRSKNMQHVWSPGMKVTGFASAEKYIRFWAWLPEETSWDWSRHYPRVLCTNFTVGGISTSWRLDIRLVGCLATIRVVLHHVGLTLSEYLWVILLVFDWRVRINNSTRFKRRFARSGDCFPNCIERGVWFSFRRPSQNLRHR